MEIIVSQENTVKMGISLFQGNGKFDNNAVGAGVYKVELSKHSDTPRLTLYIGQSVYMLKRCGEHLYKLFKDPEYLGLTAEILQDENFTLHFTVLETLTSTTGNISTQLKELEKDYIGKLGPLAQEKNSDRQHKDRVCIVGEKIKEL